MERTRGIEPCLLSAWPRLRAAALALRCPEVWGLPPGLLKAMIRVLLSTRPAAAPSGTMVYPNCPPVGSRPFRLYLKGLKRMARGAHVPLLAHVSVTDRCPNRCPRCSNVSPNLPDPTLESLARLLGSLRDAGTTLVAFTGGEPCLRPDLERIIEACGPDLSSLLGTAGAGLDTPRARRLHAAGLTGAIVSLDHFEASEHDRLRRRTGAFGEAMDAVGACLEAGLYTAVQAVVGPSLLQEGVLERFAEFCRAMGVHDVILLPPIPVRLPAGCAPLDETGRRRMVDLHRRSAFDVRLPKVTATPFLESPRFFGCQAGFSMVYVSTGGEVCPCDFAPRSFGNAYRTGIGPILESLSKRFPRPSCRCLAQRLREGRPDGEGEPLPDLMRHVLPAGAER